MTSQGGIPGYQSKTQIPARTRIMPVRGADVEGNACE